MTKYWPLIGRNLNPRYWGGAKGLAIFLVAMSDSLPDPGRSVGLSVGRSVCRSVLDTFEFFTLEDAHLPLMTLDDL